MIRPVLPFSITPHLSVFTLGDAPVPGVFRNSWFRVLVYQGGDYIPVGVSVSGEPWGTEIKVIGSLKLVRKMFRVNFDYCVFLQCLNGYPELKRLAEKFVGLRPTRSLSLYYALLEFVVRQRISLRAALRIQSRIVLSLGERRIFENHVYYGHPLPERLLDPEKLRSYGLTRMKAVAMSEVARAELEGRLLSLREVEESPEAVVEELQRIKGVGPWTAKLAVAMVSESFRVGPASDLTVRRGISRILGIDPEGKKVRKALKDLREYAGLLMYLASLDYELEKMGMRV